MPMTHAAEIGIKNRYRFPPRLTCSLEPNFSGIVSIGHAVFSCRFMVPGSCYGFSTPISGVCVCVCVCAMALGNKVD